MDARKKIAYIRKSVLVFLAKSCFLIVRGDQY